MPADREVADAPGERAGRRVVLLGPQRHPTVNEVVAELTPEGPLATVTAGWQEREPDDHELDGLLDGRSANLALYGRWLDVQEKDPEFALAELAHRDLLDELRTLHLVQLESALSALQTLTLRHGDRPAAIETAIADAEAVVRSIDRRHAERVREAHLEFEQAMPTHERESIAHHRDEVREILGSCTALFVAGGHVGVLLRLLSLFEVGEHLPDIVVAWSAGAMTLTERVVLFHDRTPQGPAPVEVFDRGFGVVPGIVVLPDARRRLLVDDPDRMAELRRRLSPAVPVALDRGDRLDLRPGLEDVVPAEARVVGEDGRLAERQAS